jgi:hypothetical protein
VANSIKFCVVCGRTIPELSLRKVTCSERCRARKKCGYAPFIDYTEPPLHRFNDLTAVQKLAANAGMSYGKYVALDYERRQKGEDQYGRKI